MNKKNIATTIVLLLCSALFTVVGSSFMNFMYKENRIMVEDPKINVSSKVLVYDAKDDTKTQLTKLEFSDADMGLKPVTGECDADTCIPSTVTDKTGSEGIYTTFKITAPAGLKIVVSNIQINTNEEKVDDVQAQREYMWLAIKDEIDTATNLKEDESIIITFDDPLEDSEYTLLFWLDGKTDKILKGAKISFDISFVL